MAYTAAQLAAYYTAVNFGQAPDAATLANFTQAATLNANGTASDQQTLAVALQTDQVRATTDVAVAIYQYFNGSAPSQAGLNFLLNTPGTGLNTSYYNGATGTAANPSAGGFNLENRYYNLAISQAFQGPNAAAFAATYGALTLQQTVAKAYEQIVGAAVVGQEQVDAAVTSIQGSIGFFQQVAAARATSFNQDLATKAIIVGYILEESIKADVGAYALAIDQHNAAIANGKAVYNANILTTYAPGALNYGVGVGGGVMPTYLAASGVAQQRLNLPTGPIVNVLGTLGKGVTLQLIDASGSTDTLTLGIYNGNTTGAANMAGSVVNGLTLGGTAVAGAIEILNVVSAGVVTSPVSGMDNVLVINPSTAPNLINISGAQPLTLALGAAVHSMTIDGSAATGSLFIGGATTTAAGVAININGGAADDTLFAGQSSTAVVQAIYGGKGGDAILLNGGTYDFNNEAVTGGNASHKPIDTLVYKAVTDSFFSSDDTSSAGSNRRGMAFANTSPTDIVFGFASGQDKIDVKGLGLTQAQLTLVDKGNVADITAFNALVATGNLYKDAGGVLRGAAQVHNSNSGTTDTYLFIDANHNGAFDATGDLVIHLVGTPVLAAGDLVGN